jgi:ADP-ribose pyrophosphatase YjhB (NUDIX family)
VKRIYPIIFHSYVILVCNFFCMKCVVQQALFICTPDYRKTLLLKRWDHKSMAWLHTGIGGHVEHHELETIEDCVWRELEEETKIVRDDLYELQYRATILHSVQDVGDRVMYCYTALTNKAEILWKECPDGELVWYDTDILHTLPMTSLTKVCYDKIFAPTTPRFIGWIWHHDSDNKYTVVYE